MCDDGYDATFIANHVQLTKYGSSHTIGHQDPTNGLWNNPLLGGTPPTRNFIGALLENTVYKTTNL